MEALGTLAQTDTGISNYYCVSIYRAKFYLEEETDSTSGFKCWNNSIFFQITK